MQTKQMVHAFMLLTLVVVPVVYVIIDRIKERFFRKKLREISTPLLLPARSGYAELGSAGSL